MATVSVAAWILAACGTETGDRNSDRDESLESSAASVLSQDWAELGIPYAELDLDAKPPVYRLGFGTHVVEVAYAGDEGLHTELLSMTASHDAAVFELQEPGSTPAVWMLTGDGDWSVIAKDVTGIPMANVSDDHVYWMSGKGPDKRLAAFDTSVGRMRGSTPIAPDALLSAATRGHGFLASPEVAREWTPGDDRVVQASLLAPGVRQGEHVTDYREKVGATVISVDGVSRLIMADGATGFELNGDYFGQFNSDGSFVAFSGAEAYLVMSSTTGKSVSLEIPGDFHYSAFQWTADDRLVAEGVPADYNDEATSSPGSHQPDAEKVTYLCTVPDGKCTTISSRIGGAYGESSFRGQIVADVPPDFDEGE